MLAAHRLPLCALFLVLATIPGSSAAPGDTLFSAVPGTISGAGSTAPGVVYTSPADPVTSEICVVFTISLSSSTSELTSGIVTSTDYDAWSGVSYPSVSEDIAALKAKFVGNKACEGADFSDTSCTSQPMHLDAGKTYTLVSLNAGQNTISYNSMLVTECTTAQDAQLGHDHDHASGASRHLTQTFTSAALAVGALALV
jgi:uncharacterized cupredoxin-like copper-binding protein